MASKRFAQQANGARVDGVAVSAVSGAAYAITQPPCLTKLAYETTADRIDVRMIRLRVTQMFRCPRVNTRA